MRPIGNIFTTFRREAKGPSWQLHSSSRWRSRQVALATKDVDLLTDANVVFTGEATADSAGTSVASAGDFNDDGIDDLLIGARLPIRPDGRTPAWSTSYTASPP